LIADQKLKFLDNDQKFIILVETCTMIIDRNSSQYALGRFLGRAVIFLIGYIVVKNLGQKPLDQSFLPKELKLNYI